jgi:hypothetical protein
MKQTAMNQLIAELERKIKIDSLVNTAILHYGLRQALSIAQMLEKDERSQIESAYDTANKYPSADTDGKKYYFMTYIDND